MTRGSLSQNEVLAPRPERSGSALTFFASCRHGPIKSTCRSGNAVPADFIHWRFTMLRHLRSSFGAACLILAAMLTFTGRASKAAAENDPALGLSVPFSRMDAKGEVSVDDANDPTKLSFDLKSNFRLGPNSDGINPLLEGLRLEQEYAGAVNPCLIVSVAAGCFTQVGKGYRVQMNDFHNCGASIQLMNMAQSPNEILPYVELLPAVDKFDLRLTPGPHGKWDLKLNIDLLASTPNGPIAGVVAILRSPTMVKLAIGDDDGAVAIGRIDFSGDNCTLPLVDHPPM